ncbi:MAG: class I SAM-dependent methyltransferase [Pseudomonadota bacterium]
MSDAARAYEQHAKAFINARSQVTGRQTIRTWAATLPQPATILELGCGSGRPVTETLLAAKHTVFAIDASPTLLDHFRQAFPTVEAKCENVLDSRFFERRFDAVVAIGLVFLLSEAQQRTLIQSVANVLEPGGRFLFTAPWQTGEWHDVLTQSLCVSLGIDAYTAAFKEAGLTLTDRLVDSGRNHYYELEKDN